MPKYTAIFRAGDGTVYTQDGRKLEGEELESIVWRDGAPPWEDYQTQLNAQKAAQEYLDRMQKHDQRLIQLRKETEDKDTPPNEERLKEIQDEVEAINNDASNSYAAKSELTTEEPQANEKITISFDGFSM